MKRHTRFLVEVLQEHLDAPPREAAEIGVWAGENSAALLRSFPSLHLWMVDAWQREGWGEDDPLRDKFSEQADFDDAMRRAVEATDFADARRTVARGWSAAVVVRVAPASLDFAFIDADHRYEAARLDILHWLPKVRPGGVLAGHDYRHKPGCGVIRAVDEAFGDAVNVRSGASLWWVKV